MGTDINGWVEVVSVPSWFTNRRSVHWNAAVKVRSLIERTYDMFGCLFGVTNYCHFRPIAAQRGLPEDASYEVRRDVEARQPVAETHLIGLTWVTWADLKMIDWDEPAEHPDARLHEYVRGADGQLRLRGKAAWSPWLGQQTGLSAEDVERNPPIFPDGAQWESDGIVYRAETLRRRDVRDQA